MDELRRKYIRARRALSAEDNQKRSTSACRLLMGTEEYKNARTIMIYKAARGELSLALLEDCAERDSKTLLYPLCIEDHKMLALKPDGPEAFQKGSFGIGEPVAERSAIISPEDIDLVVCPCAAFDEELYRLGMGGGYYDRFLPGCVNADICAIAFEVQKGTDIPHEAWDYPVHFIVTEERIYR
jgi:5-formyltetrahydrofolate cyclo-ligase